MIECTCNKCGWVHMAVTEKYAKEQAASFMEYYASLDDPVASHFGEGQTYEKVLSQYQGCFFCGQTDRDFREAKEGDCPVGCTIQPTIWEPDTTTEQRHE